MRVWSDKTEIAADRFVAWIGMARGKFFAWRKRYGKANEHNGHVPRDHWLLDEEKRKIIGFHERFPLEGYRRLTFMMIDQEVVAASPSSVYRVLSGAGLLDRWNKKPSKKGTGFVQPLRPTSTGTSTSPTSTSAVPSITCARSWMVPVVPSCIGRSVNR